MGIYILERSMCKMTRSTIVRCDCLLDQWNGRGGLCVSKTRYLHKLPTSGGRSTANTPSEAMLYSLEETHVETLGYEETKCPSRVIDMSYHGNVSRSIIH